MKKTSFIVSVALVAGAGFVSLKLLQDNLDKDPFSIVFSVLWKENWSERSLPGEVIEYHSPFTADLLSDHLPHVDGRDNSTGFTLSFPLESDLKGTWADDRLYLTCFQMALSAVEKSRHLFGKRVFPEDILNHARRSYANTHLFPDSDQPAYIRRCHWSVRPRDPEVFNQLNGPDHVGHSVLMERCIDVITRYFVGFGANPTFDSETANFVLLRVFPGDSKDGRLLGAMCRETHHPAGIMGMSVWYMPMPDRKR